MSRIKEPFTLFKRNLKSGKTVYYYQVNLPDGTRSTARSTGQSTRSTARALCLERYRQGTLIPDKCTGEPLFQEYFANWWQWGENPDKPDLCPYLVRQYNRGRKPSYGNSVITNRKYRKHILLHFGECTLDEIRSKDIENWLDLLSSNGLSGKSQIDLLSILRIMLREAFKDGMIKQNPTEGIEPPQKEKAIKRGILTIGECSKLLDLSNVETVWNGELRAIGFFLVARDTAMRPGEIKALQLKHVHFESGKALVDIHQAVDGVSHRFKETKTGATLDKVPLRSDTSIVLKKLCYKYSDPEALVFSRDGVKHISQNDLVTRLYKALENIGIGEEERKERRLTPYSFRNMAITRLRQAGVSDFAVKSLARHTTMNMTDGYTHFDDSETLKSIDRLYSE